MNNFSYLIKQGIKSVWRNRFMSFAGFCVLTVSMLLVGLSALVMLDCEIILGNVSEQNEISVYLNDDADIEGIGKKIENDPLTASVRYISPEEGLQQMIENYEDQRTLFENLPYNPVPPTYMVTVKDIDRIREATAMLTTLDGVYRVNAPMDFAKFIRDLRTAFTIVGLVLIAALGTVSVIIIANTTRLSVFARRKEIAIMRAVGATNGFIKTPFFVEGMFIGLLSGVASWLVTRVIYERLYEMIYENFQMWNALGINRILTFDTVNWYLLAAYCAAGALLGAIGTVVSTGKYLKG
ncbi:MAG: ABC transporter permease [Eubacterium sp.]|nr:ABC transporter permease [Eubacterium sp.]